MDMKLRISLTALAAVILANTAAMAQVSVTCPIRMTTTAVTISDPSSVAGFRQHIGNEGQSQAWLNGVSLYVGAVSAENRVDGAPRGARQMHWTSDGQKDVSVACLYEGGVVLSRPVGKVRACTAAFVRSSEPGAAHWGLQSAKFICR